MKQAKFVISGYFLENIREEWPQIWLVDVSLPPSEQIRFWSRYLYSSFRCHFDLVKQFKLGVSGIFFRTHGRNGIKFDMLMHPDHLWNWLHSGHGLLVFLTLPPCSLSETGLFSFLFLIVFYCPMNMGTNNTYNNNVAFNNGMINIM